MTFFGFVQIMSGVEQGQHQPTNLGWFSKVYTFSTLKNYRTHMGGSKNILVNSWLTREKSIPPKTSCNSGEFLILTV